MKTKTEKEKLFKVHEAKNTPFNILEIEKKFKITIGNEIVSPDYETIEEAKKVIETKPWWLIVATTHIISKKIKLFEEEREKINNLLK